MMFMSITSSDSLSKWYLQVNFGPDGTVLFHLYA